MVRSVVLCDDGDDDVGCEARGTELHESDHVRAGPRVKASERACRDGDKNGNVGLSVCLTSSLCLRRKHAEKWQGMKESSLVAFQLS